MDISAFDVVVIGAGIAGATAAAHIAPDRRVVLVEAEDAAGYHTTGRSAAMWIGTYGSPDAVAMTGLSRAFLAAPPPGFADVPLLHHRPVLTMATAAQEAGLRAAMRDVAGIRELTLAELQTMVPALRADYVVAAIIEDECFDIDVAALLQGFLRQLRAAGGVLALRSRAGRITRRGRVWEVETTGGRVVSAPVVVNAAGAWGDAVAALAGVDGLGLQPKRRTGLIVNAGSWAPADWPMMSDFDMNWYARPEARTKLMISPVDETDMPPHDVQPDALDVAIAVGAMQQALDIEVRRVEHSWAGLRTFTPDRSLAIGWDPLAEGFFWSVGQGGYGIQTSPAQGRLVADLLLGRDPGAAADIVRLVDPGRFHASYQASR